MIERKGWMYVFAFACKPNIHASDLIRCILELTGRRQSRLIPPYRFAEQSDSLQKQAADAAAVVNGSHEGIRRTKISGAAFFHPFLYR
ncbi:hypothetical protein FEF65_06725 [Mariprofundus erugo]|uniref:Uncharacterized protein n=1 Tax=Mariprofundus erugo TaxID=2528639 RepID=A0A5R9GMJ3_9PROT|nr:hypothetical protein [Mariprofundus erugo]TLS67601.1 hypothetical protein FEF65_06725 [Mariprofundus erugo]